MSTPAAAAALFQAALPKPSTSTSSDPPSTTSSFDRGRGSSRGKGKGRAVRGGRDEDVGMSDAQGSASDGGGAGVKRRGRQSSARHSSGPMGDRPLMKVDGKPYDPHKRGATRHAPAILREERARSSSTPASSTSTNPSTGAPTAGAIDTLRQFLIARYSNEAKMLNLENMAGDTILKAAGLKAPGEKGAPANLSPALWKLASQLFPDVLSISLANNSFTSLLPLSPYLLTTNLPNIQNVSFASNNLTRLRDMDPFSPTIGSGKTDKPKGWKNLKELVMTGNPMVGSGEEEVKYRVEMARRFPSLQQLDQQPLDPSIAFAVAATNEAEASNPGRSSAAKKDAARAAKLAKLSLAFPLPILGGFPEADEEGVRKYVGEQFLAKFFPMFDTDRNSLAAVYAPTCTFSFQVDTMVPLRTRAKKIGSHGDKKFPNQHKLAWTDYLGGGRNLTRVLGAGKRSANLHITPSSVVGKLTAMPGTEHPLADPTKFVFDTWTMPNLMAPAAPGAAPGIVIFVSVHGEFTELPTRGVRSFDRTFILAPADPGSPAQLAGWPCLILSDMFTIRGYSDPISWKPTPVAAPNTPAATVPVPPAATPVGGVPVVPVPLPPQPRPADLTEEQHQIVLQLQLATRMNYPAARECLNLNGWNGELAMANFKSLFAEGKLGPEYFLPPEVVLPGAQ
ncbi:hypothetical protein T439DRAFT_321275 [Meredithblackwellia eburnea MCA 4105]